MKTDNNNKTLTSAISTIAAATDRPFMTAFKITLGIGLAQLTLLAAFGLLGLGGLVVLAKILS